MWWCEKRKFGNRYEKVFQETKIKNGVNSEKVICFPTKEDAYGLGFIVNEKWKNNIHKQWKEDDRIAILQLNPPDVKEPKKYTNPINKKKLANELRMKLKKKNNNRNMITIINC